MKVEYLVLIDDKEAFCKSVQTLNNLIQSYDGISISKNAVKFNGKEFSYEVQFGRSGTGARRYFHIAFEESGEATQEFRTFLRQIRTILTKISGRPPETLNDDISTNLCEKAYPKIHKTENLLRKLITKFMLSSVGLGWSKENIPKEVVESIKSQNTPTANYLYEVDFIQLSKFLFTEYASLDSKKMIDKIRGATKVGDLDLDELKEFIPKSNWERYFAELVSCSNDFLEKRWQRLYELRNKVAHNRFITEDEYHEIERLVDEIDKTINAAIDNLDKVKVTDEQKEEVAENLAVSRGELYADFLKTWNVLVSSMYSLACMVSEEIQDPKYGHGNNWRSTVNALISNELVGKDFKNSLSELASFRNTLVHQNDMIFTNESVTQRIKGGLDLAGKIFELIEIESRKQKGGEI